MRKTSKIYLVGIAVAALATITAPAASYVLDNGSISTALNASDGTEPRDNWFANEFTAVPNAELLTRVDFGVFTTAGTPNSASVVIYRVTGAGGNPALGATRIYTQGFTPLAGDGTNAFLQQINLTTPVALNDGDKFLVSVFMPDVIGLPPNDKYPYLLDTSGVATGTYWDRSNPGMFNLDDLSGAKPIDQLLSGGSWHPDAGHVFIRVEAIPEPSAFALAGLVAATLAIFRRRAG